MKFIFVNNVLKVFKMNDPELFAELTQWACPIELVQPIAWDIQAELGKRCAVDFIAQHHTKWN